jgi:hypothetical protein
VEFSSESARQPAPSAEAFDERIGRPLAETVPEWVKTLIAA